MKGLIMFAKCDISFVFCIMCVASGRSQFKYFPARQPGPGAALTSPDTGPALTLHIGTERGACVHIGTKQGAGAC